MSTLQAFADNCDTIETHNAGNSSYTMGHNQFSGLTENQFKSLYLNNNFAAFDAAREKNYDTSLSGKAAAFDAIDWVAKGAVTPIKDQAQCGSCWAFSTVAGMEGQLFVAEGKLLSMSEQDLVSCDKNGDQGCNGGLMDNAFTWIQTNGLCTEADYPYTSGTGSSGTCKTTCKAAATCTGHKDVPKGDEAALYTALTKAPVSIAVDAGKFQLYKSGILDPTSAAASSSTTASPSSVPAPTAARTTGPSRTLGARLGARRATSASSTARTSAASPTPPPSRPASSPSKRLGGKRV